MKDRLVAFWQDIKQPQPKREYLNTEEYKNWLKQQETPTLESAISDAKGRARFGEWMSALGWGSMLLNVGIAARVQDPNVLQYSIAVPAMFCAAIGLPYAYKHIDTIKLVRKEIASRTD